MAIRYHNEREYFSRDGSRPADRRVDVLSRPARQFASDTEDARFAHVDLPNLSDAELRREARIVQHEVDRDDRPHPWLQERLDRLRAELRARGRRS